MSPTQPHQEVSATNRARCTGLPQDFVKWRGPLFQRFLLALVDESPRVRALAEFLLGDTLATKVLAAVTSLP